LNLIIDVSKNKTITITTLNHIKILSKKHKKNKRSLVIVAENIDYNKVSNQLNVVPTIIEATDIIELEEIERDLGF
jgi:stalled ribosome rescue protein Dom34